MCTSEEVVHIWPYHCGQHSYRWYTGYSVSVQPAAIIFKVGELNCKWEVSYKRRYISTILRGAIPHSTAWSSQNSPAFLFFLLHLGGSRHIRYRNSKNCYKTSVMYNNPQINKIHQLWTKFLSSFYRHWHSATEGRRYCASQYNGQSNLAGHKHVVFPTRNENVSDQHRYGIQFKQQSLSVRQCCK